ncbi:MAG: hypothetical protein ACAI44_36585 [Candidatus Sericytochromatia bacterium]
MSNMNVNALASQIMSQYDHNHNGQIEMAKPKGGGSLWDKAKNLFSESELTRSNASSYSNGDQVNFSSTVRTQQKLFYAADAQGNNDGKVTHAELSNVIGQFDTDKNGELSDVGFFGRLFSGFTKDYGELQKFNSNYKEELKSYSSIDFKFQD